MKSSEKKGILILILVSIVIIAVIYMDLQEVPKIIIQIPIQANQAIQNNHKLTQAVESSQKQKVMVQL